MTSLTSTYFSINRLGLLGFAACCLLALVATSGVYESYGSGGHPRKPNLKQKESDGIPPTQRPYVIKNKRYYPIPSARGYKEQGIASWYGRKFHGRKTSNGETYNMHSMTAAHKTLPMNTMLLIKNLDNDRETVVRVNDRGPFVRGRIVDLSYRAAKVLGMDKKGIARVQAIALGEESRSQPGKAPHLVYKDLNAGEFYVQIGAFAEEKNARRLRNRFTDAGFPAVIQESTATGTPLFRVQVYVGTTLQSAKISEEALLKRGYVGAFTIAR